MTPDPRKAMLACVASPDGDIADAALWMAAEDCGEVDRMGALALLDELADELRARGAGGIPGAMAIPVIAALLRDRLHLRRAGGGDPRAHYLHSVIERGFGVPVACSAIWVAVGRRAGLDVHGIALPGHFAVQVNGSYADAAAGELLDEPGMRRLVADSVGDEPPHLLPEWLKPEGARGMLARMSRNLRGVHSSLGQWDLALRSADRCVELCPDSPVERRDRGLVSWRAGRNTAALGDLQAYLAAVPGASDHERVRELVSKVRASLN